MPRDHPCQVRDPSELCPFVLGPMNAQQYEQVLMSKRRDLTVEEAIAPGTSPQRGIVERHCERSRSNCPVQINHDVISLPHELVLALMAPIRIVLQGAVQLPRPRLGQLPES